MVPDLVGAAEHLCASPALEEAAFSPDLAMGWEHHFGAHVPGEPQHIPCPPSPSAVAVPSSAPVSRAQSPLALPVAYSASERVPGGFVPLSEMGGIPQAGTHAGTQLQPRDLSDDDYNDAACAPVASSLDPAPPLGMEASAGGYESGDDMDFLSMRHCINCTASLPLASPICMDCGHSSREDDEIFDHAPTADDVDASRRRSLQGDALVVISFDERMELHEEGGCSTHPERPDRVRAVMARLQASGLVGRCVRLASRPATGEEIEACHAPSLLVLLDALSEQARLVGNASLPLNSDTYVNQHSAQCARLSAGSCVEVATAVVRGEARAGVAICRPPGHHAESNTSMGFCLFNNAGIAARAAQAAGARRVLILDWDVHHGNGTQDIFEDDPSVLYASLHRYDSGCFYPGTGAAHEVGRSEGAGCSVNVAWPCGGMRNGDYLAAFQHVILPIAYDFRPDLIIISAGFDAADGDPIGGCHLTPECYAHMTAMLQLVAPTVALLEGGYNLLSTARGMEACVRVLLGERPPPLPEGEEGSEMGMAAIALAMRVQARYWRSVRTLLARVQGQLEAAERAAAARLATAVRLPSDDGWPRELEPDRREQQRALVQEMDEEGGDEEEVEEEPDAADSPASLPHVQQHSGSPGNHEWGSDVAADAEMSGTEGEDEDRAGTVLANVPAPLLHVTPAPAASELLDNAPSSCVQQHRAGSSASAGSDGDSDLALSDGGLAQLSGGSGQQASALCNASPQLAAALAPELGLPVPTPPVVALGASSTPGTEAAILAVHVPGGGLLQQQQGQQPYTAVAGEPRDHWKRLATKAVALKRSASRSAQRLSPALNEEMQALQPVLLR